MKSILARPHLFALACVVIAFASGAVAVGQERRFPAPPPPSVGWQPPEQASRAFLNDWGVRVRYKTKQAHDLGSATKLFDRWEMKIEYDPRAQLFKVENQLQSTPAGEGLSWRTAFTWNGDRFSVSEANLGIHGHPLQGRAGYELGKGLWADAKQRFAAIAYGRLQHRAEGNLVTAGLDLGVGELELEMDVQRLGENCRRLLESAPDALRDLTIAVHPAFAAALSETVSMADALGLASGAAGRPGGIALTNRLTLRDLELRGLRLVGNNVVALTSRGDVIIRGLTPETLGVLLRGMAIGRELPLLSIGTEPSTVPGHVKVTYMGGIRHTAVGQAMLEADYLLKGLVLGAGLGRGGTPVEGTEALLAAFPDPPLPPASTGRWWLVGSDVTLQWRADRVVANSRFSLRSAIEFRGRLTVDHEMEEFLSGFNEHWSELAAKVPAFGRLSELAVAAAVARWAVETKAEVDPRLWLHPYAAAPTPEHVPHATALDSTGYLISGGVGLTGDLRPVTVGEIIGIRVADSVIGRMWNRAVAIGPSVLLAVAVVLILAPVAVIGRSLQGGLTQAVGSWLVVLGVLFVAFLLVARGVPLVLADFDSELLSLVVAIVLPSWVTARVLAPRLQRVSAVWSWFGYPALGLFAVATLCAIAVATAGAMRLASTGLGSPRLALVYRITSAPIEVLTRPFFSGMLENTRIVRHPASMLRSAVWRVEFPGEEDRSTDESLVMVPSFLGTTGPPGSAEIYHRVVDFKSRYPIFTPTGEPPW